VAEVVEDHRQRTGGDGTSRVERVAAEDRRGLPDGQVAHGSAAHCGDGAQQDGRQPAQTYVQGLLGTCRCPATESKGVDHGKGDRPCPVVYWRQERDDRSGDDGKSIKIIGQGYWRTVLQQRVTDESAAEARQGCQRGKADGIQMVLTRNDPTEDGIAEHSGQIDDPEEFADGFGQGDSPIEVVQTSTPIR
jgi:hypothetical protein